MVIDFNDEAVKLNNGMSAVTYNQLMLMIKCDLNVLVNYDDIIF